MLTPRLVLNMDLILLSHTQAVALQDRNPVFLFQRTVNIEDVVLEKQIEKNKREKVLKEIMSARWCT